MWRNTPQSYGGVAKVLAWRAFLVLFGQCLARGYLDDRMGERLGGGKGKSPWGTHSLKKKREEKRSENM